MNKENYNDIIKNIIDRKLKVIVANEKSNENLPTNFGSPKKHLCWFQ